MEESDGAAVERKGIEADKDGKDKTDGLHSRSVERLLERRAFDIRRLKILSEVSPNNARVLRRLIIKK